MQAVNYSHARNNLKSLIDEVCENNEEVIITTKNDKSVVMISLDEYNRTHAQIKRDVAKALKQVEQGGFMSIDEAFEKAKCSHELDIAYLEAMNDIKEGDFKTQSASEHIKELKDALQNN